MRRLVSHSSWLVCLGGVLFACEPQETSSVTDGQPTDTPGTTDGTDPGTSGPTEYRGEVWADNWSSMYVDGELVMEDSVSITTERSFNEEIFTFTAQRPFTIAAKLQDYRENDSGLEYIGEPNQQMGDGGYIAQIIDTRTDEVVAVTSSDWRCTVIHKAPLDKSCENAADPLSECTWEILEEPDGWTEAGFDDSAWSAATEYSEAEVSPRMGYDVVDWDASAQLIWGDDLESDNEVLCRWTVN
ncbi:MAG: hypothetical protein KTR31_41235 [Myxococcales bacterium]|nr:hypothetical protein [Myxococcales bacterium]